MLRSRNMLWVLSLAAVAGCGEGNFVLSNDSYEPKIVIEGFLQPGAGVERIHIWRNFPPDADMRELDLVPDDIRATILDEDSGVEYVLSFHPGQTLADVYFHYTQDDLFIEPGRSYTLEVRAPVEGRELHAWATTRVPSPGFRIVGVNHESLPYRPLDEEGRPINFEVEIERNPDSRLYLATVRALPETADTTHFVYDNPFTDESPQDVLDDLADFAYHYDWIQNVPLEPGRSTIELFWFFFWFYGEYEIVVHAADLNYQHFLQTFDDVQEEDGNFHEPEFEIEGDGIGVFGAVLTDRIRVEVVRE